MILESVNILHIDSNIRTYRLVFIFLLLFSINLIYNTIICISLFVPMLCFRSIFLLIFNLICGWVIVEYFTKYCIHIEYVIILCSPLQQGFDDVFIICIWLLVLLVLCGCCILLFLLFMLIFIFFQYCIVDSCIILHICIC